MFKPFKNLKSLMNHHGVFPEDNDSQNNNRRPISAPESPKFPDDKDDETLFLEAMAGVKPILSKKMVKTKQKNVKMTSSDVIFHTEEEKEVHHHLLKLVEHGIGFDVSNTPEYMEGTNYNVHPEISKRLHKGAFSIQDYVDLHGMTVSESRDAFNELFKKATSTGIRCLLIIHGRGLSSPGKPVLKARVYEWLTFGPWRKWVIAFSSARACDGGAGATYVLLRKSPLTKRYRKKQTKRTNIC